MPVSENGQNLCSYMEGFMWKYLYSQCRGSTFSPIVIMKVTCLQFAFQQTYPTPPLVFALWQKKFPMIIINFMAVYFVSELRWKLPYNLENILKIFSSCVDFLLWLYTFNETKNLSYAPFLPCNYRLCLFQCVIVCYLYI